MTPDHETDTLEGLIARWREIADIWTEEGRNCDATLSQCADELAPILAGLRALRNKMQRRARVDTDPANGSAALQARGRVEGEFAKELDALLGQPATAGAGGEQET